MSRRTSVILVIVAIAASSALVAGMPWIRLQQVKASVRVLRQAIVGRDPKLLASRLHEMTYRLNYSTSTAEDRDHPPGVQWKGIERLVTETDRVVGDRFRHVSTPVGVAVFGWDAQEVRVAEFSRSRGAWRLMSLVTPWPTSFDIRLQAGPEKTRQIYGDCVRSLDEQLLRAGYLDPYTLKEDRGERPQSEIDRHNQYILGVAWPARERLDAAMCDCLHRAVQGARCSNPDTPFGGEEPEPVSYSGEEDVD